MALERHPQGEKDPKQIGLLSQNRSDDKNRLIILIGLPGSGKSHLTREAAKKFHTPYIDLDEAYEAKYGIDPGQEIKENGEDLFRKRETALFDEILSSGFAGILAVGGGTPCFHSNIEKMRKAASLIFLDIPHEEICKRIEQGKENRSWLMKSESIREAISTLDKRRRKIYEEAPVWLTTEDLKDQLMVLEKYCSRKKGPQPKSL